MPTWMLVLYVWGSPMHDTAVHTTSIPGYLTEMECRAAVPAAMAKLPAPTPGAYYEISSRCEPNPAPKQ